MFPALDLRLSLGGARVVLPDVPVLLLFSPLGHVLRRLLKLPSEWSYSDFSDSKGDRGFEWQWERVETRSYWLASLFSLLPAHFVRSCTYISTFWSFSCYSDDISTLVLFLWKLRYGTFYILVFLYKMCVFILVHDNRLIMSKKF